MCYIVYDEIKHKFLRNHKQVKKWFDICHSRQLAETYTMAAEV